MTDYTPNEPIEVQPASICWVNFCGSNWSAKMSFAKIGAIVTYPEMNLAMVRVDDAWFDVTAASCK